MYPITVYVHCEKTNGNIMIFFQKQKRRRTVALSFFLSLLIYLYIVVRNAVRKKITIFSQYATNQAVGSAKRSAKCGAKTEVKLNNTLWV